MSETLFKFATAQFRCLFSRQIFRSAQKYSVNLKPINANSIFTNLLFQKHNTLQTSKMGSFTSFIKSFFVTPVEDYIIKPRQRHNVFQRNESDTTKNLRNLFDELAQVSPAFSVDAKNIEVLNTPQEYFENLINGIKNAKQRIILTSLYLGTGEHEKKIIEALETQLKSNPNITVHVLFDCLRGTRGTKEQKSSVTMLLPLVKKYGNRVSAFFYHTPKFNKFLKKIIPERVNEVVGVQHIKAYIFDDSMMMSGYFLSSR